VRLADQQPDSFDEMQLLDGKAVAITGAGRGLGRSFAIAAARHGAGVVVNDIDLSEAEQVVAEITAEGGTAIASGTSVATWEGARQIVRDCVERFGRLDGFVNNAVIYPFFGPAWDDDGDAIRSAIEVNVMGSLFCGAHALREMVDQGYGSLVNVTSRVMMGKAGRAVYSAAKGAVASATYSQALDAMPHNVRVNALAPAGQTRGHEIASQHTGQPQMGAGSPDLCAPGVVYLISDLSANVTGQTLVLLGKKLSFMRPPGVLEPMHERDAWTAEAIAEVVDRESRELLQPFGIGATRYDRV
jgi:NAD(P)-dependent dehydrogenase (short-subunit alcohol dehydrogenase family)